MNFVKFSKDKNGQSMVEYTLIITCIAIALVVAAAFTPVGDVYASIVDALT